MYKEVKGNIFDHTDKYGVLVHGCNCWNTMGGGIAKTIKELYPGAYEADCQTIKGDKSKLGTFSFYKEDNLTIINAYTQFNYYPVGKDLFEYESFEKICKTLNEQFKGKEIAMPKIGAGLAGGDWSRISDIIKNNITDCNVTIYFI